MSLRYVLPNLQRMFIRRMSSSGGDLIKVSVNDASGFATVTMCRKPVNSMNLDFLSSLSTTLSDLQRNECKGVILTSDMASVFCAGIDFSIIYKPDIERFVPFWSAFQDVWLKLYLSKFPTVAAINGHSLAGGCVLALGCEYRIMVGPKFTIGLNETRVGVALPPWLVEAMKITLSTRQAELAVTSGKVFRAEEALKVGLVDELVSSKEEALEKAKEFLDAQSNLPSKARSITKLQYREPYSRWLLNNREEDCKLFFDFLSQPEIQEQLGKYQAALRKK